MPDLAAMSPPEDGALLEAFLSARLPKESFHHREHLRVAYLLLAACADFGEGALLFRGALRRYAEAHGVTRILHETVTWAYLSLIGERMQGRSFPDSAAFLDAHPELLSHAGALAECYDVPEILASPAARRAFVLPRRAAPSAGPAGPAARGAP